MALEGSQVIAVEWTMVVLTLLLVLLRLYLRVFIRNIWSYADILVCVGWCFFTVQAGLDTRLWKLGLFRPDIHPIAPNLNIQEKLPKDAAVEVFKLQYVENAIYYLSMYCMKGAMLVFFYSLVPRSLKKTWLFLQFTTAFTIVGILVSTPLNLFYCMPVSRNWTLDKKQFCSSGDTAAAGAVTVAFHVLSDLFIYITPFPVLKELDLSKKQKIGVGAIFASGFLCIAFAIAVILAYTLGASSAASDFFTIWEQSWAIVVVCSPAFKSFLTRDVRKWWSRGTSNGNHGKEGSEKEGRGGRGSSSQKRSGTDASKKDDDDGVIEIIPRQRTQSDVETVPDHFNDELDSQNKFRDMGTHVLQKGKGRGTAKRKPDGFFDIDSEKGESQEKEDVDELGIHRRPSQNQRDRNRKSTFTVKSTYSIGKGSQVGEIPIMMDADDFDVPLPLPGNLHIWHERKSEDTQ